MFSGIENVRILLVRTKKAYDLNLFYKGTELKFLKSLWGLGTEEEKGYRTGPPGYIGRRNSFLGIDSWAP
jgi:hypothetical protein